MKTVFILLLALFLVVCSTTETIDLSGLPKISTTDVSKVYSSSDFKEYDKRLTTIRKGRDFPYEMPEYKTLEEWESRAAFLRERILITTGLWPLPEKTPLNAKVYGKIEREDYTVEKVYFESYPGFFVTGNLYRPKGKTSPFPAVISPHGHWKNRLENTEINSIPGRAINFAKQGYVVLSYDMVGYGDNRQVSHRFTDTNIHAAWGISILGMQLWNSIRALDFLTTLPDVDNNRLGCTGASGGGTQTFMVTAVDERIKVSAPVNMISAHFQGGCVCENVPGLRLDGSNVEIGALAAPRPLLMVAATGDWTKNTPTVEYPMMQSIYKLYGALDKVYSQQFDYPHNYNKDSREAVYAWFAKWMLYDDNSENYKEQPFQVEDENELLNFPNGEMPPGDMNEHKLTRQLKDLAIKNLHQLWPREKVQIEEFEKIYGTALKHVLAATIPQTVMAKKLGKYAGNEFAVTKLLLSPDQKEHATPALLIEPEVTKRQVVLIVHPEGKSALVSSDGKLDPILQTRLDEGKSVLLIDAFRTGEHLLPNGIEGRDESIDHFTTFNKTDLMERVQDIVTAATWLQQKYKIDLVGLKEAGPWVLLAATQLQGIESLTVDFSDIDFETDAVFEEQLFVPGLARLGHVKTAALLVQSKHIEFYNFHATFPVEQLSDYFSMKRQSVNILEGEIK